MPSEIYDYEERLQRYRRAIKRLRNGGLVLRFLDHMAALGLSVARASKYAGHILVLLRIIDFDLKERPPLVDVGPDHQVACHLFIS